MDLMHDKPLELLVQAGPVVSSANIESGGRLFFTHSHWQQFAGQLVEALSTVVNQNAELQAELDTQQDVQQQLREKAQTDVLTNLPNRRHLEEAFGHAIRNPGRRHLDLNFIHSLVLLDLDKFKLINDTHGHSVGDEVLRNVADVLRPYGQREGDVVARYGGEEFALLLVNTDEASALEIADKIRADIEEAGPTTISGGVSLIDNTTGFSENVRRVDMALYAAKNRGRNQIVLASEIEAPNSKSDVSRSLPRRIGATLAAAYSAWSEHPPSR